MRLVSILLRKQQHLGAVLSTTAEPMAPPRTETQCLTCAGCGCVSNLKTAFLWLRRNHPRRQPYCPVCFEAYHAELSYSYLTAIGILFIGGLLVPYENLQTLLVAPAVGCMITLLMMPLHELGHAVAAWVLGVPVYKIQLGWYGRLLYRRRFGRCELEMRLSLLGGIVQPAWRSTWGYRCRSIIIYVAGPLASISATVSIYLFLQARFDIWGSWLGFGLIYAVVSELMQNLYPRSIATARGNLANDGLGILLTLIIPTAEIRKVREHYYFSECAALLEQDRIAEARQCCEAGLKHFEHSLHLTMMLGLCELEDNQLETARDIFQNLLTHPDCTPEFAALLRTYLAWACLLTADKARLPEALLESKRSIDALPWLPEVQGTRGSVLVEAGEVDAGMPHRQVALQKHVSPVHRAWNAAYLALGCLKRGDIHQAIAYQQTATRLDLNCRLLPRLQAELAQTAELAT